MRKVAQALLASLGLVVPTLASPVEVVLSPPGGEGWRALEFPKIPRHTTYTVATVDGQVALEARADCSASALYAPTEAVDLDTTPRLRWRWKVAKGIEVANERVTAGDDFAARVYVMFRFDAEHASLWERARHALGRRLYGDIVPGNAINYVWSSGEPAGAAWDNPFAPSSKMLSRGAGPLPHWRTEEVDVAADYRALFGHRPPPLLAVALMTDTDNSCQQAVAYYADLRFLSR